MLAPSHPLSDNSVGSSSDEPCLQLMHQRIETLEAQQEAHKAQIERLTRIMDYESYKEYVPFAESFSDGCYIDWFT